MKPKYLEINAKCSDLCYAALLSASDKILGQHDGYVPDFMPGEHYGDYIMIKIDIETGKIVNWVTPTTKALVKTFKGDA